MEDNNKDINNWLAVTRSRNGKWWYSAFHNVTALVGAGVLGFPYAMSQLGWGPGITVLVLSWICTLYTAWQMIEMHEAESGKRFDRYHELGQYAFGEKLGLWIVVPQTLIVDIGTDIIYMITGGNSLKKAHQILCKDCKPIRTTYFIMIFASLQFFLSHLPSFNSIIGVSISAAVMSICYSTIAWTSSAHKGALPDVKYDGRSSTTTGNVFDFFTGLGTIAFGYAAHNVLLEIQATVPSTPEKPSKKAMWKGMIAAYIVVGLCYFPVAIFGYWAFGNSVTDNILMSLDKPHWLTAVANMFVVIHVTGSYQVFAVPVFDMMESIMVRRMNFRPTWYLRFISRNIYVALTMLVAIIFPFFGGLLSFLGGLVFAPTTYFLPCIIWLVVYKPKRFSGSWCANWKPLSLSPLPSFQCHSSLKTLVFFQSSFPFFLENPSLHRSAVGLTIAACFVVVVRHSSWFAVLEGPPVRPTPASPGSAPPSSVRRPSVVFAASSPSTVASFPSSVALFKSLVTAPRRSYSS